MAKSYFYDENISDWRELVKGEQGEQGPVGPVGPRGPQGEQGPMGSVELVGDPSITVDDSVGTRVFVGDTMIYGDTGWREITNDDDFLLNGWEVRSAGRFRIRRENGVVYIQATYLNGTNATGEDVFRFPLGFRARDRNNYMHIPARDIGSNPINATVAWNGTVRIREADGEGPSVMGVFMTPDPWPTSLPGTPV